MKHYDKILLDGIWDLFIAKDEHCSSFADTISTKKQAIEKNLFSIKGTVPGNFELDLQKSGLLEDVFFADNIFKIKDYEDRHLWYCRDFDWNDATSDDVFLKFEGIDTVADIYLNGELIAHTDNMFIEHEFSLENKLKNHNELFVHIWPATLEAQKRTFGATCSAFNSYLAESLTVRRAPHTYGWDIMPRIISGGLWRSVYILKKNKHRIEDIYLYTVKADKENSEIWGYFRINPNRNIRDYKLTIYATCKEKDFYFEEKLWHNEGKIRISAKNPYLWWPKNMGKPFLYNVTAQLWCKNTLEDELTFKFGIRTVDLERTSTTDKDGNGEFKFYINNEPMFVCGTNWVPLDAFHSRDAERLPKALQLLDDIGCNMVRCWGGNVYENHDFFDFCDEHGITVWQDFAMACAIYPQDDDFCNRLKYEVESVVKKLRNHTSLVLWSGDNEVDECYALWTKFKRDPNKNKLTRQVIPDVVERMDITRPYIPSSPYIDKSAYDLGKYCDIPERHLWGPRDYFKSSFYSESIAHFASETGYHGCNAPDSIKRFISFDKIWPWENNFEWLAHATCIERDFNAPHAYRIPLMVNQIKVLFGEVPDTLEEFALASQISQAEADKYFIERFRTSKWRRTGIIWWNLLDGWPQFSDAIVDYYYNKKLAYNYIKNSQASVCLMFNEAENGELTLVGANELLQDIELEFIVNDISTGQKLANGKCKLYKNSSDAILKIPYDDKDVHFYLIEWKVGETVYKNHYISGKPPFNLKKYIGWAEKADLLHADGFSII